MMFGVGGIVLGDVTKDGHFYISAQKRIGCEIEIP